MSRWMSSTGRRIAPNACSNEPNSAQPVLQRAATQEVSAQCSAGCGASNFRHTTNPTDRQGRVRLSRMLETLHRRLGSVDVVGQPVADADHHWCTDTKAQAVPEPELRNGHLCMPAIANVGARKPAMCRAMKTITFP